MARSFNDEITRLSQQKQALSGRAPSRNEIAGLVEGVASGASDRLATSKQLNIQQQAQDLNVQRLAEEKRLADTEIQFAHDATLRDIKSNREETGAQLGGSVLGAGGTAYGGPIVGAGASAVGSYLGKVAGGSSWICSAIHKEAPWTLTQQKALMKLFRYVYETHKPQFDAYQRIGKQLAKFGHKEDILPIIKLVKTGDLEKAYQEYYQMCQKIIESNKLRRAA